MSTTISTSGLSLSDLLSSSTDDDDDSERVVSSSDGVVSEGDSDLYTDEDDSLDKDDFLSLLITQLEYQDPLDPQDNSEYVAQLAQFSTLETMQNMDETMSDLSDNMNTFMTVQTLYSASQNNAIATSMLGKEVRVADTEFDYDGSGDETEFNVQVDDGTESAYMVVYNSDGEAISSELIEFDDDATDGTFTWDGLTDDGDVADEDTYTISIEDSDGDTVGYAYVEGAVSGVKYTTDGAQLVIDGETYALSNLLSIDGDEDTETDSDSDSDTDSDSET
ncbi:MAG TPA: flagellar hook capping FlgD N-terminal domain-containing protein [Fibrobacteraceae bacterium]|nr:flagellar hook capping FlgD N-terminal domain-containing protein [Fibrobacteraceae bacterium]